MSRQSIIPEVASSASAPAERIGSDLADLGILGAGGARAAGLSLRLSAPGEFRVTIRDEGGRALMELGPFAEDEIVGAWRKLSADSGLPFVLAPEIEEAASDFAPSDHAATAKRPSVERRKRLAVLAGRRPRFLTRRHTGRLPRHPHVHAAREIASGTER